MSYSSYDQFTITRFNQEISLIAQEMYCPVQAPYVSMIPNCYGTNQVQYTVQMDPVQMSPMSPTPIKSIISQTSQQRRFVKPLSWVYETVDMPAAGIIIDGNILNAAQRSAVMSSNRKKIELFIDAVGGNALAGAVGSGNNTSEVEVPLPSDNIIPVDFGATSGTAVGMTQAKLQEAIRILSDNFAYNEMGGKQPAALLNSKLKNDLLNITTVTSNDFNRKSLIDGKVRSFLDINFLYTNQPCQKEIVDGVLRNICYVWMPDMVGYAEWQAPMGEVFRDSSLQRGLNKLSYTMICNYTRMQEAGVVKIICA